MRYLFSRLGQSIVLPWQVSGGHLQAEKSPDLSVEACVGVTYFHGQGNYPLTLKNMPVACLGKEIASYFRRRSFVGITWFRG